MTCEYYLASAGVLLRRIEELEAIFAPPPYCIRADVNCEECEHANWKKSGGWTCWLEPSSEDRFLGPEHHEEVSDGNNV